MTIATYTDLQAAIANWLARADLTSAIPDLIALAETRIAYGSDDPRFPAPALRLRAMEQTTDPASYKTAAGAGMLALPAGFLEARSIYLDTNPIQPLTFVTPETLNTTLAGSAAGRPSTVTLQGDNLRFGPMPDSAYGVALSYYRKFDPLSQTASNWLLQNAPGVYLYGALIEAAPYIGNDERIFLWAAQYAALTNGLMGANQRDRFGSSVLMVRTDTGNP